MKLIYNNYIPIKGFSALNFLGIWLFVRRRKVNGQWSDPLLSEKTLNHENIHSAQYKEMGYIGFLVWYIIEWLIRVLCEFALWAVRAKSRVEFKDIAHAAYKNISLEQEAYYYQDWPDYLKPQDALGGKPFRPRYMWRSCLADRSYHKV